MTQKLTTDELANLVGVSKRQVLIWRKDGLPVLAEKRHNALLIDSGEAIEWLRDQARRSAKRSPQTGAMDWTQEKRRLEVETLRGTMVSIDEIRAEWTEVIETVRKMILAMPNRLAAVVANQSEPRARKLIDQECKTILREAVELDARREMRDTG